MTEGIVTPIASSPGSTTRASGGRTIGYGEFGDPNGKPVVLFHGFGDSRLTRYPDDELTARLGIRLITFDRPGIGLTDPMKELTILDRTDDVIDLVKSLGLQDLSLLGWSGGAPYALAAAGCMAGNVKRVAIVSGFGPLERPGFKRLAPREIKRVMTILKVAPWMANVMATESQKGLQGDASAAMEMSRGLGGSADSSVLNMSGVRGNVTSGAEEAFRQGPAGVANDMLLLFRFKWGFNPEDVHTPIDLWYGDDDHMTPPAVGRGLASILPQPRLRMVPGAGHLLYLRNWEEILRTLVADEAPVTATTFQAIAPVASLSPVTETLAAASLGETTPVAEAEYSEPAGEPVTAQGDVLGTTPAWSWTQPAAASQPSVEAPAETPAEREPVAYQEEPVAPVGKPEFTPRPQAASASGDQLARLRALGFLVDVPEPVVAELEVAEPETTELGDAETEAEEPVAAEPVAEEPEAIVTETELAVVEAETAAAPEAEAAPAEPEVARPELRVVAPEAAPKRPSLTWQPIRVPGLIIGKPRRIAPVEPAAPAAETIAEATPEPAEVDVVTEAEPVEPEAAAVEQEAAAAAAEPETVAEPEAESFTAEAEPAAETPEAVTASPAIDSAEAQRLRAAGFSVSGVTEPEAPEEASAEEIAPAEPAEARRAHVADDELARLRAAGFAPAEAEPEVAPAEVGAEPETEAVEARAVAPESVEPKAVEAEPAVAEAETVEVEVEAAPIDEEPVAEAEPAAVDEQDTVAEEEPAAVATELEEEASEAVVLPPREHDDADRWAGAGFAAPESEPAPAIAASAADAPIMKAAARTREHAELAGEHVVETGVGWVETVPVDVGAAAAAASAQTEPDSPPEPMVTRVEDEPAAQAPVRDETLERLRAAGFLIGEPRGR